MQATFVSFCLPTANYWQVHVEPQTTQHITYMYLLPWRKSTNGNWP